MRILMTTDTVGGVWTFTQELATGLLQRGCTLVLVSFGRSPSLAQQEWTEEITRIWPNSFRYKASEAPLEWMRNNERAYSDAAPFLNEIAVEFRPNILLSSQYCFGALPLAIPKLLVAHSDVLSWAEFSQGGSLADSPWLRNYISLVQNGLAAADSVVAPTRWMLNALGAHFTLPSKTGVIPNGRTIVDGRPSPRKLQAVTAGRLWDEAKNIALLRHVQYPIPIFIAGEDRPTAAVAVPPNVNFTGALPAEDLHTLFRGSSIYICPSLYEPFGLAPLEAALCGCAVLANDIPSLREVWQDGALYFSGATELTALLRQLSQNPQQLNAARWNSFRRAQSFSSERMADSYLQLFRNALNRAHEAVYAA
ncbi:MAG TPA: glycosyltransferase family 4 protein [Silvibacterium sp.]|nr:glycosyltransferase family 4 protein [Silvibacterium sp.]